MEKIASAIQKMVKTTPCEMEVFLSKTGMRYSRRQELVARADPAGNIFH